MKILIVDDEVVALNALKKRVDWQNYGYGEVFTVQSALEAKAVTKKENIDTILCDVEMPGEDGLSFIAEVKKTKPDTVCIMITCHAEFDYIKRAMKYGVKDYILKPIDYEELGNLLSDIKENKDAKKEHEMIEGIISKAKSSEENIFDIESNESRVRCIKHYIEEHLHEKISAKQLADLVHINEQYLMRIFKREQGQSINDYITERKIIIASQMLKDTDHSINFISDCVGCDNYSYFTKLFKKQTGFTPREYRNQFQK